ncbi:hypothetical protein JG687_00010315 [Phytophthora cactorum]|uniref:Uncharacterized protein n=1 Tax=Phytophthora cactorum TaxID=29920 RepID=A0A8T1U9A6_9STRA|nr:hypothetical protein JG687_00010315 [Phytophthora cactorum]
MLLERTLLIAIFDLHSPRTSKKPAACRQTATRMSGNSPCLKLVLAKITCAGPCTLRRTPDDTSHEHEYTVANEGRMLGG